MRARLSVVLTAALAVATLERDAVAAPPVVTPIDGLGEDLVDAFTGYNLLYYGGAVAETGVLAFSGADYAMRNYVQRHLRVDAYADISLYTGYIAPIVLSPLLWFAGIVVSNRDLQGAGSAVIQATVVAIVTDGILKVGVGRAYPLDGTSPDAPDKYDHPERAHTFRPFKTFIPDPAWPSGHTVGMLTMAAALTGYYPDKPWIALVGYPAAAAVGLGMVDGDRHWVSDVVAGALIGHAIGWTIGRDFRRRMKGDDAECFVPEFAPLGVAGATGVSMRVRF